MKLRWIFIMVSLACSVAACGQLDPAATTDDPNALESPSPDDDPFAIPSDDPIAATSSATTSVVPGAPTPPPARTDVVLPNNYFRPVGSGYFRNWLYNPQAVAIEGGEVLVADGDRVDARGAFGGVLEFMGRTEDAVSPVGNPYSALGTGTLPARLGPEMKALAATHDLVYVSTGLGVFGFMRDSRNALNLGRPYTDPAQDMAIGNGALWCAQGGTIRAFVLGSMADDPATPSMHVMARGLETDAHAGLWVAGADGHITRYQDGQVTLTFDGKGTDAKGPGFTNLRDVAVDPRNGDVYALDQQAIVRFDGAGRFLSKFGPTTLHSGRSIAIDAQGDLFVVDDQLKQVLQFEPGR